MECKVCHKIFDPKHFNQKCCSNECRITAKRRSQEKYKKTEKGELSRQRWVHSERFKQNEKRIRTKPRARALAVIRAKRHLAKCIKCQRAKAIRDKQYAKTELGRKNNNKAKRKYRQTEKGKWQGKIYKYYLRNNWSGKISKKLWEEKLTKLEGKCQMCGTKNKITIDHIIPLSRGGTNEISNLQPLCISCNCSKNNKI